MYTSLTLSNLDFDSLFSKCNVQSRSHGNFSAAFIAEAFINNKTLLFMEFHIYIRIKCDLHNIRINILNLWSYPLGVGGVGVR